MSISHADGLMHGTRCPLGDEFKTWNNGLPSKITDRDLDSSGAYSFDQVLKLDYPKDFHNLQKINERIGQKSISMDILRANIPIEI